MNPNLTKISGWGKFPKTTSYLDTIYSRYDFQSGLNHETIARGLGRSYGDQAINTDRSILQTLKLNKFIDFNVVTGILECESGVSFEEIIKVFAPRGWFPMICPGTKFVTIGGAIANDIHGKAHHSDGSFANCVISCTRAMDSLTAYACRLWL